MSYSIGIDFGTGSGRVLIVDIKTGAIAGMSVHEYKHGVIENELLGKQIPSDYSLQHAPDYMEVLTKGIPEAIKDAKINPHDIKGIGVDFTSSTMVVTDDQYQPLSEKKQYKHEPHAYVKLWKHHGATQEANKIFKVAQADVNNLLGYYGFQVSDEWMIPKILELKTQAPDILNDTSYIMEAGDWIVSTLVGENIRSNCARGFKAFWNEIDGFDLDFFSQIDVDLPKIISEKFSGKVVTLGERAGYISEKMSEILGLPARIPVAPAIIDAHSAVLGIGSIKQGQFTMVMGTSTCHLMLHKDQKRVPGISGSVYNGIMPQLYAYEAGQSAVGDLFATIVNQAPYAYVTEAHKKNITVFDLLEEKLSDQPVGQTGLLALDWHNGNRSPLSDSELTGALIGKTLHTKTEDIYRAYMEATAFGTRMIMEAYENHGLHVNEVFACGGLPKKNNLLMQIYADVLNKPIHVSDSDYAPAIGAAILGAVAGEQYASVDEATQHMKQPLLKTVYPKEENVEKYEAVYELYKQLHNYFGIEARHIMDKLQKVSHI